MTHTTSLIDEKRNPPKLSKEHKALLLKLIFPGLNTADHKRLERLNESYVHACAKFEESKQ